MLACEEPIDRSPVMKVARTAAEVLSRHVTLEVESIDRMYLNVYVPLLQRGAGAAYYFREYRSRSVPSPVLMAPMTRRFVASIKGFARQHGIETVSFRRGERKDDRTREFLRKWSGGEGVLYIGKAQEKARALRTERRQAASGESYPWLVETTAMVNHYYFYIFDDDFGPFFLKFCSYFPYNAKLCINGNEYLKRQLEKRGIEFEALDNGILRCSDPDAMQRLADGLSADNIDGLLRKWLSRLPHPFPEQDVRRGIRYAISILQAEFSLTQVFDRPVQGRVFFEQVMRENLDIGRPENVQLIFKRRISRRTPSRYRTRVITDGVTPSLHVDYKHSRIKQYHKEGRALRTETVINDTYDFDVGRLLSNLDDLKKIGFAANRRLLDAQCLSHDCLIGDDVLDDLHRPKCINGQRASALRFGDRRVQGLFGALLRFSLLPNGFRNRDLREAVAALAGLEPDQYHAGRMTYDLRRLRLRGIIERIPNTHRYRVTHEGRRIALAYHRTYARVLRPVLATTMKKDQPARLQRVVVAYDRDIERAWNGLQLAA